MRKTEKNRKHFNFLLRIYPSPGEAFSLIHMQTRLRILFASFHYYFVPFVNGKLCACCCLFFNMAMIGFCDRDEAIARRFLTERGGDPGIFFMFLKCQLHM